MTAERGDIFAAFHEAEAAYEEALHALECASLRERPVKWEAVREAEAAMYAALRGES